MCQTSYVVHVYEIMIVYISDRLFLAGMGNKSLNMDGSRQRFYVSNAGGRTRVGACASAHFGQGLAASWGNGNDARWTANTWLDNL